MECKFAARSKIQCRSVRGADASVHFTDTGDEVACRRIHVIGKGDQDDVAGAEILHGVLNVPADEHDPIPQLQRFRKSGRWSGSAPRPPARSPVFRRRGYSPPARPALPALLQVSVRVQCALYGGRLVHQLDIGYLFVLYQFQRALVGQLGNKFFGRMPNLNKLMLRE